MRTLLLVGIAAIAAVSAKPALATHTGNSTSHSERRVIIVNGEQVEDAAVYQSSADRAPTERDYRGRWQGEWNGTWETPEGQVYHGTYDGNYDAEAERARHVTHERVSQDNRRWRDDDDRRDDRRGRHADVRYSDDDLARMCRRDDGVGGGLIGGVVGGVVGNRVAGRGNRTAGTLIGAGAGAILGAVVDRAEDRTACNAYWSRSETRDYRDGGEYYGRGDHDSRYRDERYRDERYYGYDERYASHGYGGGYDYIPGAPTTIVIPSQPVIIEETETYYETVTVAAPRARVTPRRRAAVRARPRPRPACTCR